MANVSKTGLSLRGAGADSAHLRKLIVATSLGNALEWFDISVYGYFAVYLAKAFFPANDPTTSLLLTLGTFGISFLIRPIGGIVLGTYADRVGRKASLLLSIGLMTVGSLAIAIMPTYATIGVLAPIGVLAARLMQGFSAGGEFASSTALLVEHAPDRRGYIASWQFASQGFSTLLAASFGFGLSSLMPPDTLQSWGWRLPFFFGILVGPTGLYILHYIEDAQKPPAAETSPVQQVLRGQKLSLVLAIGALAISTAVNYLIVYLPTYAVKSLNLPPTTGFLASLSAGVVLTVLTPIAGIISDHVGRTRHMLVVGALLLVSIHPAFVMLTGNPTLAVIVAAALWLATLKSLYYGPLAALMAELFPVSSRATGLGISYNVGVTLFGGLGPVAMASLGELVGNIAPSYYLTLICILSLVALAVTRWRVGIR